MQIKNAKGLSNRAKNILFRNDIFTLSDLIKFVENNDLLSLKNLGNKTLLEIEDFIAEYNRDHFEEPVQMNEIDEQDESPDKEQIQSMKAFVVEEEKKSLDEDQPEEANWFPNDAAQISILDISSLLDYGVSLRQCTSLRKAGYNRIGDLGETFTDKLITISDSAEGERSRVFFEMLLKQLTVSLEKMVYESVNDRSYTLTLLQINGQSLQDIGEREDLTRERVRQIISKYLRTLNPIMECIVNCFFDQKGYMTVQDVQDISHINDINKIILLWCQKSTYLDYLKEVNIFLPIQEVYGSEVRSDFDLIAKKFVNNGIKLSEHMEELDGLLMENGYSYISASSFVSYMLRNGYGLYGQYLFRGKLSHGEFCSKIVAERFPDGIRPKDNQDIDLLKDYVLEKYGEVGLTTIKRSLGPSISNYLVLRGRGLYTAKDNIYVEPKLLKILKEYIDSQSGYELYYSDLFAQFEKQIRMMSNIDNYHFLHGVLKLYFTMDYDFTHKDYLKVRGKHRYRPWYLDTIN